MQCSQIVRGDRSCNSQSDLGLALTGHVVTVSIKEIPDPGGNLKRDQGIRYQSSCSKIGPSESMMMLRYQVNQDPCLAVSFLPEIWCVSLPKGIYGFPNLLLSQHFSRLVLHKPEFLMYFKIHYTDVTEIKNIHMHHNFDFKSSKL